MAKKVLTEKELSEFLHAAGCKEITEKDKITPWYKKASEKSECLKTVQKEKVNR